MPEILNRPNVNHVMMLLLCYFVFHLICFWVCLRWWMASKVLFI